jgi:hypothetical protein
MVALVHGCCVGILTTFIKRWTRTIIGSIAGSCRCSTSSSKTWSSPSCTCTGVSIPGATSKLTPHFGELIVLLLACNELIFSLTIVCELQPPPVRITPPSCRIPTSMLRLFVASNLSPSGSDSWVKWMLCGMAVHAPERGCLSRSRLQAPQHDQRAEEME